VKKNVNSVANISEMRLGITLAKAYLIHLFVRCRNITNYKMREQSWASGRANRVLLNKGLKQRGEYEETCEVLISKWKLFLGESLSKDLSDMISPQSRRALFRRCKLKAGN
jgi:hypothetical protein